MGIKMNDNRRLLHVSVINGEYAGHPVLQVVGHDGECIEAYDCFQREMHDRGASHGTIERYSLPPIRLIDYFYEAKVIGMPTTNEAIKEAIAEFKSLLEYGPNSTIQRVSDYARKAGIKKGLAGKSFSPTLSSINLFLTCCQDLARQTLAHLKLSGIPEASFEDLRLTFTQINQIKTINEYERRRLSRNSLYGGVVRILPGGRLQRTSGLKTRRSARAPLNGVSGYLDFPIEHLGRLIDALPSHRDKAYFLLAAGGGLRGHEIQNLRKKHIDTKNLRVWVEDPRHDRTAGLMPPEDKLRFKGRTTAKVVFFEPLKSLFFEHLKKYLDEEAVPLRSEDDYVFQIIEPSRRGAPLRDADDRWLVKSFQRAVRIIRIPPPNPLHPNLQWTPHSLRHLYGVYMYNFVPLENGQYGFRDLTILQALMGHSDIDSVRHYARIDRRTIDLRMEVADEIIYNGSVMLSDMPEIIARRLIADANAMRQRTVND